MPTCAAQAGLGRPKYVAIAWSRPLPVRHPELPRRHGEEELARESVTAPERRVLHRARAPSHECPPQPQYACLLALQRESALDLVDRHAAERPGARRLDAERPGVDRRTERRRDLALYRRPRRPECVSESAPGPQSVSKRDATPPSNEPAPSHGTSGGMKPGETAPPAHRSGIAGATARSAPIEAAPAAPYRERTPPPLQSRTRRRRVCAKPLPITAGPDSKPPPRVCPHVRWSTLDKDRPVQRDGVKGVVTPLIK